MNASNDRRWVWAYGAVLLLALSFFRHPLTYDNINTRMNLVAALSRDRTTRIDPYHANTIDKAVRDGHYYCDKAPGLPIAALPVYSLAQAANPEGWNPSASRPWMRFLNATAFWTCSIPSALAFLLLALALARWSGSPFAGIFASASMAFGTMLFPYSGLFYEHAFSAAISTVVFCGFYFIKSGATRESPVLSAASGAALGWLCATEYVQAPAALALAVYGALCFRNRKNVVWMIAGLVPALSVLFFYNAASFGSPFRIGYQMEALEKFQEMQSGLGGVTAPRADVLWRLTLGAGRGLFWLSPVAAFAAAGFLPGLRDGKFRTECILALFVVAARLAINAGYYAPYGGFGPGPRHLASALPFLAIPLAAWMAVASGAGRGLALSAFAVSAALTGLTAMGDPHAPEIFSPPVLYSLSLMREGLFAATVLDGVVKQPWAAGAAAAAFCAIFAFFPRSAFEPLKHASRGAFLAGVLLLGALYWGVHFRAAPAPRPETYYYLGAAFLQRGAPETGAEHLSAALALRKGWPQALYLRGLAWQKAGQYPMAEADFRQAAESGLPTPLAWRSLAANLIVRGLSDEAGRAIGQGLERFPGDPELLNLLRKTGKPPASP